MKEDVSQEELCLKFPHVVLHLRRTQDTMFSPVMADSHLFNGFSSLKAHQGSAAGKAVMRGFGKA